MLPHPKARKYDRQLRLWDSSGQEALENAHVCLLGTSAAATETAKNLVLAGLGELTIIDDALVDERDVETNFFVTPKSVGSLRCASIGALLKELNNDLEYTVDTRSPRKAIEEEPSAFWTQFTLVITCKVEPSVLMKLSSMIYEKNIPLLVLESVSFYGYLRISLKEHTIIETHPESLVDLRLDATWGELDQFIASYNLDELSPSDREHVPFVVLLLIYLQKWRHQTGKSHPETSEDRAELRELINEGRIIGTDQENYDECIAAVWRLAKRSTVPRHISDIISSPRAQVTRQSSPFWILVAALSKYLETYPLVPLSGVLPDMKADTKGYVNLQQIYRRKAEEDFQEFKKAYLWVLEKVGLPDNYISEDIAEVFCKHSAHLKVIDGTRLEYAREIDLNYNDDKDDLIHVYAAMRAWTLYRELNVDDSTNLDVILREIVKQLGSSTVFEPTQNVVKEILRANGHELHNISALMGGIAAQEAVKLISHQYVPMENTVVYDGIYSRTECLKL